MSDRERTGSRDSAYSQWHRLDNMRNYLEYRKAWALGMVDIDSCECCRHCWEPLALVETQVSDKPPKCAPVTANLARRAGIPAFSVSIVKDDMDTISRFRVQAIAPEYGAVQDMLPHVYAYFLWQFRERHQSQCTSRGAA